MLVDMDTSFGECVNQKQVSVIHEMENRVHILRQPKEIAFEHTELLQLAYQLFKCGSTDSITWLGNRFL